MKIVRVEWRDSNTLHGWQYGEQETELAKCETIGFLIKEDDDKLVVAQTVSSYGAQMGITVIAKGCIKSIKEMRIK